MHGPIAIGDTSPEPVDVSDCLHFTIYFTGEGTIAGGVISIEEASVYNYPGTWWPITTFNAADVTDGKTKAVHLTAAAYSFIRLRETTPVSGGGTLTARSQGLKI
jgi:hypothetical protein